MEALLSFAASYGGFASGALACCTGRVGKGGEQAGARAELLIRQTAAYGAATSTGPGCFGWDQEQLYWNGRRRLPPGAARRVRRVRHALAGGARVRLRTSVLLAAGGQSKG
ncbi:hypothetical protein GCM10027048_23680 [Hymenobacter coalescens]